MGLDDDPGAMKTEPIMALADRAKWFPAPVFGRLLEAAFRFADGEDETTVFPARFHGDGAIRWVVPKGIREQLDNGGQQKLGIDLELRLFRGHAPFNFCAVVGIRGAQFLAQILHKLPGVVGYRIKLYLTKRGGNALEMQAELRNHSAQAFDLFFDFVVLRDLNQIRRLQFSGVEIVTEIVRQLADESDDGRHRNLKVGAGSWI